MDFTLRDATMKYEHPMAVEGSDSYKQRLEFNSEQLPEISTWQPGGEYLVVVKIKEVTHELKMTDGESKECAYFEVMGIGAIKDGILPDYETIINKKLNLK